MEGQTNDLRIVNPQRCGDVAFACWFSFEPNTLLRQLTGMVEEELVISPELGHVPEAEWSPLFGCAHVCVCCPPFPGDCFLLGSQGARRLFT